MNEVLWSITRAAALLSIVLLTGTFVLGMLTANRTAGTAQGRTVLAAVHRNLALLMVVFVTVHVLTAVLEGYVDIGWLSTVLPFTAGYQTGWIGLGTIGFDLVLAVVATSLLRTRLSRRVWRGVHLTSYALWPIALAHGVGSVSVDTGLTWAVVIGSAVAGTSALVIRLVRLPADTRRRAAVTASGGWRVQSGAER